MIQLQPHSNRPLIAWVQTLEASLSSNEAGAGLKGSLASLFACCGLEAWALLADHRYITPRGMPTFSNTYK